MLFKINICSYVSLIKISNSKEKCNDEGTGELDSKCNEIKRRKKRGPITVPRESNLCFMLYDPNDYYIYMGFRMVPLVLHCSHSHDEFGLVEEKFKDSHNIHHLYTLN